MEKSSNKIDRITQEIVRSGGLHEPSAHFMEQVMEGISKIESKKISYSPLISRSGWIILSLIFLAIIVYVLFFSNDDYAFFEKLALFDTMTAFEISLPKMKLSKEMIYGIGFLGLFLLQIPFLKRQLDRVQY